MYSHFVYSPTMPEDEISANASLFLQIKNERELAELLQIELSVLQLMALHPDFRSFYVAKKEGEKRLIEYAADENLKYVLTRLNRFLQCVYSLLREEAAYGFMIKTENEKDKRGLLANASQHLGCNYLFHLDLEDFFHQISTERIRKVFENEPFNFPDALVKMLVSFTTLEGRLPMGSPTSPILSHFACRELDDILQKWANFNDFVYTRFADDIAISTKQVFKEEIIQEAQSIITGVGYKLNQSKLHIYHKDDPPLVTGVCVLADKLDVPISFLREIKEALELLKLLKTPHIAERNIVYPQNIQKLIKSIRGQIAFVGIVRGKDNETYLKLMRKWKYYSENG